MFINGNDTESIFVIIKSKNVDNILEIIRFIWQVYREKSTKEHLKKIEILWAEIYQIFKDDVSNDSKSIFSTLSKWFVFITEIDDKKLPILKESAKYTERNHNSYMIIEGMVSLVDNNPKAIGEIYLEMIANEIYPDFKQEDILIIIEKLFQLGEYDNALMICNKYKSKGAYFLNEISKQYSKAKM